MRKILAKELKIKFIRTLNVLEKFSYEDGNPFLIKIGTKRFFIFLKNLSPAYFKNSPDVTRVQLPYSEHFSKIFKAEIPFIILGYDVDNDTVVCWNPDHIKQRLNAKSNVSLYSRESLQTKVKHDEFRSGYLSNGEKIIIFKRTNLINFFDNIQILFKEQNIKKDHLKTNEISYPLTEYISDKLLEITDKSLILEIKPLLKKNKVLEAVKVCTLFYNGKYRNMTFKDWFNVVNKYHTKINTH
jgi:hypothetical protein